MSFKDKVAELQKKIDDAGKGVAAKESCFPTLMVVGIAIPFVILLLLFFLQPSFVQKKEGNKYVRDGKRIFYWTLAVTLIGWLGLYLYSYCMGFSGMSMVCAK
jgi:Trk-type K+ transport system membrane component